MVGRGPTGAGVLVLSILVVLAAESCRAQKGWCHTVDNREGGRVEGGGGGGWWKPSDHHGRMRPCWFYLKENADAAVLPCVFLSPPHSPGDNGATDAVRAVVRRARTYLTWPCVRGDPLALPPLAAAAAAARLFSTKDGCS